ncbi:hypothetical protein Tco_1182769 [Tanacetum coccineum]
MSKTNSQADIASEEQLVLRANKIVIKKNNQRVASNSHITDTMLRFVVEILRHHKLYKLVSLIVTGIVHSTNLDFASLIWEEFEWQSVERSPRPSKMSKLLYTRFTKPIINHFPSKNKSDYKFGMEILDTMIINAIKKLAGYKLYMAKKVENKNAKTVNEPEEKHVSPVKSGRRKGCMCYGDQVVNVLNKPKKDVLPRKIRSLTLAEETIVETYAEWGQKLKGPVVEDPTVQSLLDLRKGSKASIIESLRHKKQAVTGEGSSNAHNKHYADSDTNSDAILYSSCSEESENETDDADDSDMDLSINNPNRNLLNETPYNDLMDLVSNPVYTDAQTTSAVIYAEGNPELTSYISGAQKFREYDQKLEAVTNFNVFEAFKKAVQAKVLIEMKKLLPTHIPKAVANYVRPRLNTSVLDVIKNNQISLFTQSSTSTDDIS